MVKAETAPREQEPKPRRIIIYAGQSERRKVFVEATARHAALNEGYSDVVLSRSGGPEEETSNVVGIMRRKIDVVDQALRREKIVKPNDVSIIVAADIRTRVVGSHSNKGKPKAPEEVRRLFQRMSRDDNPYYAVEAGSGVKIGNERPLITFDTTTILLDPERVKYFSTPEGFAEYVSLFKAYYASPIYANNGTHPPVEVTDLAAGLSLPVLIADNAVLEIDGVEAGSPEFRKAVKTGIYNVAIGFNPHLLKHIWPNVQSFINRYDWLEASTAFSLQGRRK
ncbi:MAG: hypothetical protein M1444_02545 [Patescibacteria group bacterium]|nr:hypothetical protein [Patescibacteria group bacterium]